MDSESQTALTLSQMETGVAELERTVQSFELAVARVEHCMDEVEQPARDESDLQPLTRALQKSQAVATLVYAANAVLDDTLTQIAAQSAVAAENDVPLPVGTLICSGQYRLVQLLHRRPRVHLYLARRQHDLPGATPAEQALVAVREIVLTGLAPEIRQRIVRAAFEEFAAPQIFGSPHLPGVGDHVYVEGERHYLIMQPRPARGRRPSAAIPLAELLPGTSQQSIWPDPFTALRLGIRLCQTVARLHSVQTVLGELTPAMVLVSRESSADWAPLLLAAWPPALSFWPDHSSQKTQKLYAQIFPPVEGESAVVSSERAFVAPEIFAGLCDERSDIYALGALLYLLFTGSAPIAAPQRLRAMQTSKNAQAERHASRRIRKGALRQQNQITGQEAQPDLALTSPHVLNERISPLLEQILLRALALDPQQRFASALDLAEALEGMYFRADTPDAPSSLPQAKVSRLRKLLEWLRK